MSNNKNRKLAVYRFFLLIIALIFEYFTHNTFILTIAPGDLTFIQYQLKEEISVIPCWLPQDLPGILITKTMFFCKLNVYILNKCVAEMIVSMTEKQYVSLALLRDFAYMHTWMHQNLCVKTEETKIHFFLI